MPRTVPESEFVESFHAYTSNSVRFELRVWRRELEVATEEGTTTVSGLVAVTDEGFVAYPRGNGVFRIPALGISVLAEKR